jgi:hypothetical protein
MAGVSSWHVAKMFTGEFHDEIILNAADALESVC